MKRVFVALAVVLFAGVAHADNLEKHEAMAVFTEGVKLHDQGREEEARIKFLEAYALQPSPNVVFALARAEQLTGRDLEAIEHYRQCVRHPDLEKKGAPGLADRARAYMGELRKRLGRIVVDAPTGSRVVLDGTHPVGDAPLADVIDVKPGKHLVEAKLGTKTMASRVEVAAGEEVHVRPTADDPAYDPPEGPAPRDMVVPTHSVERSVKVPVVLSLAAGSLAAFAASGGFFLGAQSRDDDAKGLAQQNPSCPPTGTSQGCRDLRDAVDARTADRNLGRVFVGAGIGFALAATVTLLLWPDKPKKAALVPYVGPTGSGGSGAFAGMGAGAIGHF